MVYAWVHAVSQSSPNAQRDSDTDLTTYRSYQLIEQRSPLGAGLRQLVLTCIAFTVYLTVSAMLINYDTVFFSHNKTVPVDL